MHMAHILVRVCNLKMLYRLCTQNSYYVNDPYCAIVTFLNALPL